MFVNKLTSLFNFPIQANHYIAKKQPTGKTKRSVTALQCAGIFNPESDTEPPAPTKDSSSLANSQSSSSDITGKKTEIHLEFN